MSNSYHTGPDLPPVTIELPSMTVTKLSVGTMDNNVYILANDKGDCVIVDAAAEADRIIEHVADKTVHAIITTHEHHDHTGALETLSAVFPEAHIVATPETGAAIPATPTMEIRNGMTQSFGDLTADFITLRGHTPVGLAVVLDGTHILTGDSLFPGGIGKTPSEQAFFLLFNDVRDRIFNRFDDSTVIHPGHGDSTTVGEQRPQLPEWEGRRW